MRGRGDIVVHAYGVVGRDGEPAKAIAGLGGAPVLARAVGRLRVLYSVLDNERFGRAVWEEHANDPAWLRDVARAHHAVLQAWFEHADVLPFRLPSLHVGEDGLEQAIRGRLPDLARAMAVIRGRWEWGLKVFLEPDRPARAPTRTPPRTGRDYLVGRARAGIEEDEARQQREETLRALHAAFSKRAVRNVLSRPHESALSGRRAPMLLNASYLVSRTRQKSIEALADSWDERLRALGLHVELTGPWPPYHFSTVGEGTAGAATRGRGGTPRGGHDDRHP